MSVNMNTTTNGTQLPSCSYDTTAAKIGGTFAYCLIFVVSLVGNSLFGITVYKTRTMRKPINLLLVNIAMSFLLYSIFLIPQKIREFYVGDSWLISGPLGQASCKLVNLLRDAPLTVSAESLLLIVVDQFHTAVFPLRSPFISSKRCPFFILATWVVAVAAWSPHLFASKLVEYSGGLVCVGVWIGVIQVSSSYKYYMLAMVVVGIYTPLVLEAFLYTRIYFKVKSITITDEQSANERQSLIKRQRTVLNVAIIILLTYVVCWLPISIVFILFNFVSDIWSCGFQYFAGVALFICLANCAIYPCIPLLFSSNYRQSLRKLVRFF